jgi:hypothetical protein
VKAKLGRVGTRRQKVRAAERRQEIIKRNLIGDVNRSHTEAPFAVAAKNIVIANRDVEQVARRDPGRIVIVILGARCRNRDSR